MRNRCNEVLKSLVRTILATPLPSRCCTVMISVDLLDDQLMVIDRELYNKNQALTTDLRCLDLRSRLNTGTRADPATQTDRNIVLTRMQDEIPPE
ncbi:tektin 2 (testicular) [Homalodisca vitripennis]|nr:tektin 2 (testicular) [Homalodisca vitripennis]